MPPQPAAISSALNPPAAGGRKFETFSRSHREQLALGTLVGAKSKAKTPPKARITVTVRKRPLTSTEVGKGEADIIDCTSKKDVTIREPRKHITGQVYVEPHEFKFDRVYDQHCTNRQVYNSCVKTLVDAVFEYGCRASCFAYGQTGSGKTYTMVGPKKFTSRSVKEVREDERGLWEWAAIDLIRWINQPQLQEYGLYCSFFEIYCNKIYDLLADRKLVRALETKGADGSVGVVVKDLTCSRVENEDNMLEFMDRGLQARIVAKNSRNNDSSRGHAILTIEVKHVEQQQTWGKLAFIDLAGSERGSDSMAAGRATQTDGVGINKSLLALKECIRAMDRGISHIPFRDSELTKVLKDLFIGESALTLMIANVSPSDGCCEQTLNTMRYADRVFGLRKNCKPCIAESSCEDEGSDRRNDIDEEEPSVSGLQEYDEDYDDGYANSPQDSTPSSAGSLSARSPGFPYQRFGSDLGGGGGSAAAPPGSRPAAGGRGSSNRLNRLSVTGGQGPVGKGSSTTGGTDDITELNRSSIVHKSPQSPRSQVNARVTGGTEDVLSTNRNNTRISTRRPVTAGPGGGGSSIASSVVGPARGAAVRTGRSRGRTQLSVTGSQLGTTNKSGRETLAKTSRGPTGMRTGLETGDPPSIRTRLATDTRALLRDSLTSSGMARLSAVVDQLSPSESSFSGGSSAGLRRRHRRPRPSRLSPLKEGSLVGAVGAAEHGPTVGGDRHSSQRNRGWLTISATTPGTTTTSTSDAIRDRAIGRGRNGGEADDGRVPRASVPGRVPGLLDSIEDGDEFDDEDPNAPRSGLSSTLQLISGEPRSRDILDSGTTQSAGGISTGNARDLVRRVIDPPPDPSIRLATNWSDDELRRCQQEFGSIAWQEWRRMMSEYSKMMTQVTHQCIQHVTLSKSMDDMVQTSKSGINGTTGAGSGVNHISAASATTMASTAASTPGSKESLKSINVDPAKLKEVRETVESQIAALVHFGRALVRTEIALSNYDQVEREIQRRTVQSVQYYGSTQPSTTALATNATAAKRRTHRQAAPLQQPQ